MFSHLLNKLSLGIFSFREFFFFYFFCMISMGAISLSQPCNGDENTLRVSGLGAGVGMRSVQTVYEDLSFRCRNTIESCICICC